MHACVCTGLQAAEAAVGVVLPKTVSFCNQSSTFYDHVIQCRHVVRYHCTLLHMTRIMLSIPFKASYCYCLVEHATCILTTVLHYSHCATAVRCVLCMLSLQSDNGMLSGAPHYEAPQLRMDTSLSRL
jgi:hypothetical protein